MKKILSMALIAMAAWGVQAQSSSNGQLPRYIFYFIGDGMGMGPVMATQNYNRMVLGNEQPLTMMQLPVVGWSQTWSHSSPVTDSAAAGTALATGSKTRNGMLGMAADTTAVNSVAALLHDQGYGVGIVTTVAADDATPGAFFAHVPYRKMAYEIDCQGVESGYEYIAGASWGGFTDKEGNATDLSERLKDAGVEVLYGAKALGEHDSRRVLLLGDDTAHAWNVSYTIDSVAGALTLPAMTADCLQHLEKYSPERFFMMVEGGNIDHALHANDGGAAIKETLNFDQAIEIAYRFYQTHPEETLIVVTADHDTGGLALGNGYLNYDAHLELFDYQRTSKEAFSDYCKALLNSRRIYTWEDMKEQLADQLGLFGPIAVSEKQEAQLKELFDQTFEMRNSHDQETLYANFNAFAVEVFKLLNDMAGVGFTTTKHSGNPVPVFAVGPGSDKLKGFNNNTDLHKVMVN